jgi:surface antigen/archaellum component FlaC
MIDNSIANPGKDKARLIASYLFSLSLFALASSIAYFTYEMAMVSKQIPDILMRIDNTTEKVEPVIADVGEIIDLVPGILKEVEEIRKIIPPILEEVKQTRKMIPPILSEVEQTRNQVPAIVKESQAIRGELPAILASADKASDAVADVSKQVEATRPLIPKVLKEVETTRESIPPMMDRADQLIEKAHIAGKEASQGAVTGFFSGIIKAPFELVGDAGRSISGMTEHEAKHYTDKDFQLNQAASLVLLNNASVGDEQKWENTESGNHGIVLLKDIYTKGEYSDIKCRTLVTSFYKQDELIKEVPRSFCKNEEGKWALDD